MKVEIARILKEEGYISTYKLVEENKTRKTLRLFLKYTPDRRSVITDLRRVSKPGSRRYIGASEIRPVVGGMGISILTTPKGVMTGRAARKARHGRRSVFASLVGEPSSYVANWKKTDCCARGREDADRTPSSVEVQGPKGKMTFRFPGESRSSRKARELHADASDRRAARAARSGARAGGQRRARRDQGFKKELDIVGVGYRAGAQGQERGFALGYSHPVEFPIPEGIQITVEKQTHMTVSGADRGQVGQVAADIRALASARSVQAEGRPH